MRLTMAILFVALVLTFSRVRANLGICGQTPFADIGNSIFICQIAEAYFSGLTNGTSATTYSPGDPVTREQMAAFITRTMDQSLKRGSRRAALGQFASPTNAAGLKLIAVGNGPRYLVSDGADLWAANSQDDTISRVRGSDGKVLETWTGATRVEVPLVAAGQIFAVGQKNPGSLYSIDPSQAAGPVSTVTNSLAANPAGLAFDGARIWTANLGTGPGAGSVSIVTLPAGTVTTVSAGFNRLVGIIFDGSFIWVTDGLAGTLLKLDSNGAILQTVTVGSNPQLPAFDGTNIWVPNATDNSISVVRASTGVVLATLTGNGLNGPTQAAFDGQRILAPNSGGDSVSLWKATDLTPLGTFSTGGGSIPIGACSDGVSFWIGLLGQGKLARF